MQVVGKPSVPSSNVPRAGRFALVRNRPGLIDQVRPFGSDGGQLHLVRIEYKDDLLPKSEELLWELEPSAAPLSGSELPHCSSSPMPLKDLDALVHAASWTALTPYLDPDSTGPLDRLPAIAPLQAAVELEEYQLVPLHKAMQMPRVNLMIADDVGLGKTVEAGLILTELLTRRKVNRVLILTPASLAVQWQDELNSKFSLPFEAVDRDSTLKLRRNVGIDANPWRYSSRIIASYHYLRQEDILEQFLSASESPEKSWQLPWDLLIVDEVHNLMPAPFGPESDLSSMLRRIAPLFEHRLFLTATPHNGHTWSFTGLLEMLDPVRFSQAHSLSDKARERVSEVVVRRLKRQINARSVPSKFCERMPPEAVLLTFSQPELNLIEAFENLRREVRRLIASSNRRHSQAGAFALEILGKRMLSCPMTFLESWRRCKLGLREQQSADDREIIALGQAAREELADDREAEQREVVAAGAIGSWLVPLAPQLTEHIAAIDQAAASLGLALDKELSMHSPKVDTRFAALKAKIEGLLLQDGEWRSDERLVIFTEYKTTLDYLLRRLHEAFPADHARFACLFGGLDSTAREAIKESFADPKSNVRVLLATDAASEGLNLQDAARYMLHFDCPWNPARLEQRNGRLDRYGQLRDVYIFYLTSDQDADLKFMSHLIKKVEQIREDLGATGELFDEAVHRRLVLGEPLDEVVRDLDQRIDFARNRMSMNVDETIAFEGDIAIRLNALKQQIDLSPQRAYRVLDTALSMSAQGQALSALDADQCFRINNAHDPAWRELYEEYLRVKTGSESKGRLPRLTFSPDVFKVQANGRSVFRPMADVRLLHLAHPLIQQALDRLSRSRLGSSGVSRWSVAYAELPADCQVVITLHLEELAVNDLRETFHHWVRRVQLPVSNGKLGAALSADLAVSPADASALISRTDQEMASELFGDVERALKDFIREHARLLTADLKQQLALDLTAAQNDANEKYNRRHGEISDMIISRTVKSLEREMNELLEQIRQGQLFQSKFEIEQIHRDLDRKEAEVHRIRQQLERTREHLNRERERITREVLPKRFAMGQETEVLPIAVQIYLPLPKGAAQ